MSSGVAFEPVTANIGAEVTAIDLSQPLSEAEIDEIKKGLQRHLVLFFRNQKIDRDQQKRIARYFGDLHVHPFLAKVDSDPAVILLENDRDRPPAVNIWHSDLIFLKEPPMGAVLASKIVPEVGGDTLWSNMYAAYEALSDKMKRFLSDLNAVHKGSLARYREALGDKAVFDPKSEWANPEPTSEHPLVRTHPETGRRFLFFSATAIVAIKDMKSDEGRLLMDMLRQHIQSPDFQVRFRWRRDDIVIWDNRCTQHYATADYWPHRRVMHRVTIAGDAPYR